MRIMAALILAGSLAGCVGDFTTERINARYDRCRANTADNPFSQSICESSRQHDLNYRTSLRRFTLDITGGGEGSKATPVIILNP